MDTTYSRFRDFPDELILEVINHIDTDDLATIHALNATDRRLHRVTKGHLYRRFPGRHGPEQFLRTIALFPPQGSPEIANQVKEVVWYYNDKTREALQRRLPLSDRRLLANQLETSGCILNVTDTSEDLAELFVNLESEHIIDWWYLEFFLFFTPKVESVIVHDAWQWDDHLYWFENVAANPTHFQHLKSITLHGPLRLQNLVPLFALPSIRNMELNQAVDMRQEPDRTFSWAEVREKHGIKQKLAGGSSLERLVLQQSDLKLDCNATIPILESLSKLKSFTYEYLPNELYDTDDPGEGCLFWPAPMRMHSLEHLLVREANMSSLEDVLMYFGRGPGSDISRAPLNLRTLDIGPFFLQNPPTRAETTELLEIFPNTLEMLQIQWNQFPDCQAELPDLLDLLLSLAEAASTSGWNLTRIAIVDWPALKGWFPYPDRVTNLERAFKQMNMQFAVVYEDVQGQEPLEAVEDEETGWMLVHRTQSFETHYYKETGLQYL
jgi:hypothetical protein